MSDLARDFTGFHQLCELDPDPPLKLTEHQRHRLRETFFRIALTKDPDGPVIRATPDGLLLFVEDALGKHFTEIVREKP